MRVNSFALRDYLRREIKNLGERAKESAEILAAGDDVSETSNAYAPDFLEKTAEELVALADLLKRQTKMYRRAMTK